MELERFVLTENLRHLRERLTQAPDDVGRQIRQMIVTGERELALFEAGERGARNSWDREGPELEAERVRRREWFRQEYEGSSVLASLIDPRPGLVIVDVNPSYAAATGVTPADIAGRPLFAAFPERGDDPEANGVANLYASLRRVAETGASETMPVQRYDTRAPEDGAWVERYWRIENSALRDGSGRLVYLLHLVAEVHGAD